MTESTDRQRYRKPRLRPGEAEAILADTEERTTREIDGLQVRPSGEFRRRGLVAGWTIEGSVRIDGDVSLAWLSLRPDDAQTNARVTSRLLRSIPLGVLLDEIRQRLLGADQVVRAAHLTLLGAPPEAPPLAIARGTGRRRLDDARKQALLRRVAIAYLRELGEPGVYARLARRFRRDQDGIKALVRAARADQWLSGGAHGARGALPGPRLLQDEEFMKRGEQ